MDREVVRYNGKHHEITIFTVYPAGSLNTTPMRPHTIIPQQWRLLNGQNRGNVYPHNTIKWSIIFTVNILRKLKHEHIIKMNGNV